jgi:hypothetical protein
MDCNASSFAELVFLKVIVKLLDKTLLLSTSGVVTIGVGLDLLKMKELFQS